MMFTERLSPTPDFCVHQRDLYVKFNIKISLNKITVFLCHANPPCNKAYHYFDSKSWLWWTPTTCMTMSITWTETPALSTASSTTTGSLLSYLPPHHCLHSTRTGKLHVLDEVSLFFLLLLRAAVMEKY